MSAGRNACEEASWPDQLAAALRVDRRLKAVRQVSATISDEQCRELRRLVEQERDHPGDGLVALQLIRAAFDRRADQAFLTTVGQSLRLGVGERLGPAAIDVGGTQ